MHRPRAQIPVNTAVLSVVEQLLIILKTIVTLEKHAVAPSGLILAVGGGCRWLSIALNHVQWVVNTMVNAISHLSHPWSIHSQSTVNAITIQKQRKTTP